MRWRNTLSKSDSAAWQIPAIGQCWATLTHLEMPGTFTAMGTRGTQPRAWGTSLLWLLAKTNCNPTHVFSCKASATLVDGMRFKPGPSNLLTWSCETAAICRSHVSGFACKCHSFGVQVMGLVGTTGGTDNAHRKSQSSEDKGLVLFSRGIWELGQLSLSLCPPCSALRWLGSVPVGVRMAWRGQWSPCLCLSSQFFLKKMPLSPVTG